jgi:hypothetical protein
MIERKRLPSRSTPVVLSLGLGIDSSAVAVLMANGDPRVAGLRQRLALATNGDLEAEVPPTYQFRDQYLVPYLEERGLAYTSLAPAVVDRHGQIHSNLYDYYFAQAAIPTRARRSCTHRFKIITIQKHALDLLGDGQAIEVMIGFDCNEVRRTTKLADSKRFVYCYPLIELGIDRLEAAAILLQNGLPVPRRSACFCCPFSRSLDWHELGRRWPHLYDAATRLEENVRQQRGREISLGYKPLREHHRPRPHQMPKEAIRLFNLAQSYLGRVEPAWPSHALCLAARDVYGFWWVEALRDLDLGRHTPDDPWQMYVRIEYSLEASGKLPVTDTLPCGAWELAEPVTLPSAGQVGRVL